MNHIRPLFVPDFRLHLQLVHPVLQLLALLAVFLGVVAVIERHCQSRSLPGDIRGRFENLLHHIPHLLGQGPHIGVALLGNEAADHPVDLQPNPPFFHRENHPFFGVRARAFSPCAHVFPIILQNRRFEKPLCPFPRKKSPSAAVFRTVRSPGKGTFPQVFTGIWL